MAIESYANLAQDTLASGISNVDVSATLVDASEFPSTGTFRIRIEDELIKVTARSSNVLTIVRGQEGTTAVSHASGSTVTQVLTATGLQALGTVLHRTDTAANLPAAALEGRLFLPTNGVHLLRDNASSWDAWGPIYQQYAPLPMTGTQTTTLSGNGGSISSGATSAIVASSTGFPSTPFLVKIGTEDVKVTNVSGTTWTIVRGYNGTTAATHNDGVTVTQINWEWVNQGGASLNDGDTFLNLYAPTAGGSHNCRILKNVAPATPYTVTAYLEGTVIGNGETRFGMLFRESSSGKISVYEYDGGTPTVLRVTYYSGPTAPVSAAASIQVPMLYPWLRIKDDGTNRLYYFSRDGQNWIQQYSEARTTNLTADEYGWFVNPINVAATNIDSMASLYSIKVT
jgi:hypothetical protein